jgi:hypothetical protein
MSAWHIKFKKLLFREHRALEPGRGFTRAEPVLKAAAIVIGITMNISLGFVCF